MINLEKSAIGRDTKDKIRYIHIWTEWINDKYLIHRESGLLEKKSSCTRHRNIKRKS